jgi:hypothetical protein
LICGHGETITNIGSFEDHFLDQLQTIVNALPAGSAELTIGQIQSVRDVSLITFSIKPRNTRSSPLEGRVSKLYGIEFKIGQGSTSEFFFGSSPRPEKIRKYEERFFLLCRAVFTTNFKEKVTFDRNGKIVSSKLTIRIDGKTVRLCRIRVLAWIIPGKRTQAFSYEPYN